MRPLKAPMEGGPHRRMRSGSARAVQPVGEPKQDILECFGQQAQVLDVRGTGVEILEICCFRSVWTMRMLEREQLVQPHQALAQAPGENGGVADIVDQRESRLQRRFAAEQEGGVLQGFGMEPQEILQLAVGSGSQVEHHVLLCYRTQDARGFKTRLGFRAIPDRTRMTGPGTHTLETRNRFYPAPEELAFPVAPSPKRGRPEMQDPSGFARPSLKSPGFFPDTSVPALLPRGCPPEGSHPDYL